MPSVDPAKPRSLPKFRRGSPDLTGQQFSRLTVIRFAGRSSRSLVLWECQCDCGEKALIVSSYSLTSGEKRSCGCLGRDVTRQRSVIHGMRNSPTYASWRSMRDRCGRPSATGYERYGGRGIQVCKRWSESFESFLADMGKRPSKDHQLERIDNDSDYCPENCKWATRSEQARNRRKARHLLLTFNGETMTPNEWAERLGLSVQTIYARRWKGWPMERVLSA